MTEDAPKIASTLEWTKLFMAACLIFLQVPLMFQRINPFGILLLLGSLYMSLNVARVLSTHVTAAGISQLTWRGRIQILWSDVTAVTRRNRSIVLTSSNGSVTVPIESFYDSNAAVEYFNSHLPKHLGE
jgi:hypothetical protein